MIDLGGDVTGNGISKLVFTILSAVAEAERDRAQQLTWQPHRTTHAEFHVGMAERMARDAEREKPPSRRGR